MRILTLGSLLLFLGAGVALAGCDEGLNPFRSVRPLDEQQSASPRLVPLAGLIEL